MNKPIDTTSKPRMGETADDLWLAVKDAAKGVVTDRGIIYPVLRVVCGDDYTFSQDAAGRMRLTVLDQQTHGMCARDASDAETDDFHRALSLDRVQVLLMTRPGYGSDYGARTVLKEMHSPSGLGFNL